MWRTKSFILSLYNNLIVMSKENFDFFKDYDKFKKSKIHYIPNRSLVVKNDFNAINEIKKIRFF